MKVDYPIGSVEIRGDGKKYRYVASFVNFKKSGYPYWGDNNNDRYARFIKCLKKLYKIENLISVAFPQRIGCGNYPSTNWLRHAKAIKKFARLYPGVRTVVYV